MKKIGLLDSGIGGLSLLSDLLSSGVRAEYYYISDSDNVPYGEKSQEFMLQRIKLMVNELLLKEVEAIIIACNTATAETINKLRTIYNIPFIGIEPYINYLNHSKNNNIALILTKATYNSKRFKSLKDKYDPNNIINIFPLEKLALYIEQLKYKKFKEIEAEINKELNFLENDHYDYLILGCTHYPLIKNYIERKFKLKTIDPNKYVIEQLIKVSKINNKSEVKSFFYKENIEDGWIDKSISWLESIQN